MCPVNRAWSVFEISHRHSFRLVFLYEKLGGPVTKILVFATEILVTGMKMLVPI